MTTAERVLVLIVYVLAVARLTRLINFDEVFSPIRDGYLRAFKGHYLAAYFITCPWCVGLWLALLGAWPTVVLVGWPVWTLIPVGLAGSMLIGVASPLSADDDFAVEAVPEPDDDEQV